MGTWVESKVRRDRIGRFARTRGASFDDLDKLSSAQLRDVATAGDLHAAANAAHRAGRVKVAAKLRNAAKPGRGNTRGYPWANASERDFALHAVRMAGSTSMAQPMHPDKKLQAAMQFGPSGKTKPGGKASISKPSVTSLDDARKNAAIDGEKTGAPTPADLRAVGAAIEAQAERNPRLIAADEKQRTAKERLRKALKEERLVYKGNLTFADPGVRATTHEASQATRDSIEADLGAIKVRREAYLEALSNVRSMDGQFENVTASKKYSKLLPEVSRNFPKDWINESDHAGGVTVQGTTGRGWHRPKVTTQGEVFGSTIKTDFSQEMLTHEMVHRMQALYPAIQDSEHLFWDERMRNDQERTKLREQDLVVPLSRFGGGYTRSEKAFADEFYDAYQGKLYQDGYTGSEGGHAPGEMASMAISGALYRNGEMREHDPDSLHWALGLMATVGMSDQSWSQKTRSATTSARILEGPALDAPTKDPAQITEDRLAHALPLHLGGVRTPAVLRVLGPTNRDTKDKYTRVARPDAHPPGVAPGTRYYTAERRLQHDKWIGDLLDGIEPGDDPPKVVFVAGGPGSGKSSVPAENMPLDAEQPNVVEIDQDYFKKQIKEYRQLSQTQDPDPYASDSVHREAADLAHEAWRIAQQRGLNVVVQGTGNTSPRLFSDRIAEAKERGYETHVFYASAPVEVATERAAARAKSQGRAVPARGMKAMHANVSKEYPNVEALFEQGLIDSLQVWDTREDVFHGGKARLMALGKKGGDMGTVNEELMAQFLAKANADSGDFIKGGTFD